MVQSWLASWCYGLVERGFGGAGIQVLAFGCIAALLGLVWRLTRGARTLVPRVLITGLVIVVGEPFWAPRPLLFGLVCFAGLLVLYEDRHDPRWAIPVLWVWANCHGSFPLGLVALACIALGTRLDGKDPARALRFLLWAGVGTVLAAVSPLGPQLLVFPVHLLGKMEILQKVVEWQSPNFSILWARVFLLEVVLAIVAFARRPRYRDLVPALVFLAATLLGLRNMPLASIVLVPGIARGFAGLGGAEGRERGPLFDGLAVVAVALTVALGASMLARPAFDLSTYPVDALAWLQQQGLDRPDVRLATQDTTGNAIELLWGPDHKVFVDDRYDMYPQEVMRDYLVLHAGAPGWQQVLDSYGIGCVLWGKGEPLPQLLASSPDWAIGYQDPQWVVACRRPLLGTA